MGKYKYILTFGSGDTFDSYAEYGDCYDGVFDSYEDAESAALEAISNYRTGSEVLNMSNPGDYDYDEDEEIDYDVEEID